MELVLANALVYMIIFFHGWKKYKISFYSFITLLYALTALFCVFAYSNKPSEWNRITLIPFVYLFGVLMLLFTPLTKTGSYNLNLNNAKNGGLKFLCYIFVLCAFVDVFSSIEGAYNAILNGQWNDIRRDVYSDVSAAGVVLYDNPVIGLAKNIASYLMPFSVVYFYYLLTTPRPKKIYLLMVVLALVLPEFLTSIITASRGPLVELTFKFIVGYILFNNSIPLNQKKLLFKIALVFAITVLIYTISVTVSRFGETDMGSADSVIFYFGHSMLSFNDGLFNNLHDYAWGNRFFSWFVDLFGGNSYFDFAQAGSTHGTAFVTIVGSIFMDWGPFITPIVALIAVGLVQKYFKKPNLLLSDCIIIVFYVTTLARGIFVFGKGRALTWIMTFIVYFIVKKIETKK